MRLNSQVMAIALLVSLSAVAPAGIPRVELGHPVPDFTLTDLGGGEHHLRNYRGQNVVLTFIAARCPISRAYRERINTLNLDYGQRPDVAMIAINSNANETVGEIKAEALASGLLFPILRDSNGRVADLLGAERTPTVYVIDQNGLLRYRGRIDSAHNPRRDMRHDLREALEELLNGRPVTTPETVAAGCPIVRSADGDTIQSLPSPSSVQPTVRLLRPAGYLRMIKSVPGKVVVVNFWATWCGPCVAELPELIRISQEMKSRGVRFVGISADEEADLASTVVPFLAAKKVPYEQYLQQTDDPQKMIDVVDKTWPGTLPATFIYNRSGKRVFQRLGIVDRETLITEITKALK